jgi:MoaA/NifB/PqqE/SkfB family radical SAM enzyme
MASTLVQISAGQSPGASAASQARHLIPRLPVLVLFPHNQCNCRCVMCDIWRIRQKRQIETADLLPHLESFRALGTRWIALSGGEALLHDDLRGFLELLRGEGMRITLLSTGLLLKEKAELVSELVDDVIVSLDGPRETHNAIRRVRDAYERMAEGIAALKALRPEMAVTARSTVQRNNFRELPRTVNAARELGLNSISFLAVDATSTAFNHEEGWKERDQARVLLTADEVAELAALLEQMTVEYAEEFRSGFIQESPEKVRRIVRHFRAALGQAEAVAPRCNAPWVSAVVESDGTVRPCFFHLAIGNIHEQLLAEIVNGEAALRFRAGLDIERNETCRRCVCSLYYAES